MNIKVRNNCKNKLGWVEISSTSRVRTIIASWKAHHRRVFTYECSRKSSNSKNRQGTANPKILQEKQVKLFTLVQIYSDFQHSPCTKTCYPNKTPEKMVKNIKTIQKEFENKGYSILHSLLNVKVRSKVLSNDLKRQ